MSAVEAIAEFYSDPALKLEVQVEDELIKIKDKAPRSKKTWVIAVRLEELVDGRLPIDADDARRLDRLLSEGVDALIATKFDGRQMLQRWSRLTGRREYNHTFHGYLFPRMRFEDWPPDLKNF